MKDSRKKLKLLLIENDVVLAQLARKLSVTRGHVNNVLAGRFPSMRVVNAVAEAVGLDPEALIRDYIPNYPRAAA